LRDRRTAPAAANQQRPIRSFLIETSLAQRFERHAVENFFARGKIVTTPVYAIA
jgi:hypothetical protein